MKKLVLPLLLVFVLVNLVKAQDAVSEKYQNSNGDTYFVSFGVDAQVPLSRFRSIAQQYFGVSEQDSLKLVETVEGEGGILHQGYTQLRNGVPVMLTYLGVHSRGGNIISLSGEWANLSDLKTSAQLSEVQALEKATKYIGAESYKWQIETEESNFKLQLNDKAATYFPKGELVIVKDFIVTNSKYRLAYRFDVYAHKPLERFDIYVDAIDGRILHKNAKIKPINAPGTADTRYSGTRNFTTDSFGSGPVSHRLRETRGPSNVPIQTFNMRAAGASYGAAVDFVDVNNNWTAAEFNNANRDNAGLEIHWATELVHDYWRNVRGRNSWNNAGGSLLSYINADLVAINPNQFTDNDNAFWDGSRMTYGRGTALQPLSTLDITAHEIGHGLCDNLVGGSGMTYASESGAIEEGLSDIWAAVVEQASVTGKQTWLLGEDVTFGTGLRDFANPVNSGQPNTYMNSATVPTNYFVTAGCSPSSLNDQCGVHRNSGVMNRWFFLLSQGGSGFNNGLSSAAGSGTPWQVSGIGIANAATIVFRAEDSYFTAGTTYPNARTFTIQAARDIFGVNSCQEIAVTNAWNAVGVGAKFAYPSVTISGSAVLCTSGTYSLSATPAGTTVTWSSDQPWILSINSTTGVATKTGNGPVTITATITTGCSSVQLSRSVHAGTATPVSISVNGTNCTGYSHDISITTSGSPTSFNWYASSGNAANATVLNYGGGTASFYSNIADCYGLTVSMTNSCGVSTAGTTICVDNCFSAFKVYPNPAKDYIAIQFATYNDKAAMPDQITLYDEKTQGSSNNMKAEDIFKKLDNQGILKLDVSSLPRGVYFLHISHGRQGDKKTEKVRIVLE